MLTLSERIKILKAKYDLAEAVIEEIAAVVLTEEERKKKSYDLLIKRVRELKQQKKE